MECEDGEMRSANAGSPRFARILVHQICSLIALSNASRTADRAPCESVFLPSVIQAAEAAATG